MHIEPTSRCTLFCPACPRTWFSDTFKRPFPKHDLDLDQLSQFLDCESGWDVKTFMLNGNHGDPIYYPALSDMIQRFRDRSFKISTNGSYQTADFWHQLAQDLTENDTVYFSIDGLEHNNHLYRRNSDWTSIMQGLDIMVESPARIIWKTVLFSYNQDEIERIKSFAESKGALFVSVMTDRWGDVALKPREALVDASRLYTNNQSVSIIDPQCESQEYISADGYYWPCCLITSVRTLHKTPLWKNQSDWAIKNQNLDRARLRLKQWKQDIVNDPVHALDLCKMHCKPGQKFAWSQM